MSLIYDSHLFRPDPKKQVEEDLEKASAILKIDDDQSSEGNSYYRLLHELFTFALEHHLDLAAFLDIKDDDPPSSPSPQCHLEGVDGVLGNGHNRLSIEGEADGEACIVCRFVPDHPHSHL